jgi:hypothetical protein
MERQSNRVSEQQRCAPSLHFGRGPSALLLHALYRTRPLCTPAPCLHLDEALLHYCSMPPFGRGPSALLLHASIWTRPLCTTAPCPLQDEAPSARTFSAPDQALCRTDNSTCWKTLQTDNYHLSAYETQLQHPARTLTPSKFCYYLI